MNAEQLSKVGSDLVRRCGTRDPFRIANALGINVMDDCENLGSLKGMYCIVKRNRFIFLNKDLSPQMKRIVCAHEIGHDRLHRALAKKHGLQEFVLYDMATKPEYEANIVAAEILLDSDWLWHFRDSRCCCTQPCPRRSDRRRNSDLEAGSCPLVSAPDHIQTCDLRKEEKT